MLFNKKVYNMLNLQSLRNMGIASALCVSMFSPSYADDTEIFFGQSEDAFETNPNIIFVLDTSGSMTNTDGTNVSRMNRMQNAMRLLLDQATNFNVGLMAFNGRDGGSAVRYPVGDLDTDASELCPNGCLLYTSPSPRDLSTSRMPSSA